MTPLESAAIIRERDDTRCVHILMLRLILVIKWNTTGHHALSSGNLRQVQPPTKPGA